MSEDDIEKVWFNIGICVADISAPLSASNLSLTLISFHSGAASIKIHNEFRVDFELQFLSKVELKTGLSRVLVVFLQVVYLLSS